MVSMSDSTLQCIILVDLSYCLYKLTLIYTCIENEIKKGLFLYILSLM